MAKQVSYPEHDKLKAVQPQSQAIGEFLDWLGTQGAEICSMHEHTDSCFDEDGDQECGYRKDDMVPVRRSIPDWLALHFGIDQKKLEAEKRALLDSIRS